MTPIDDFSDIKPKGAEKLPRDKFNVPKTIKEINMSEVNLHGINETKAKIEVVKNHNNDIEKEVYPVKRVERNPSTK